MDNQLCMKKFTPFIKIDNLKSSQHKHGDLKKIYKPSHLIKSSYNTNHPVSYSNFSITLRDHLNIIMGLSQILMDMADNTCDREISAYAKKICDHSKIINQVDYDYSLIKNKSTWLKNNTIVDLKVFLNNIKYRIKSMYIRYDTEIDFLPVEGMIETDKAHLTTVLINLISNGIKYNKPKGKVSVEVISLLPLSISISDTGIGIPSNKLESIFQPFYHSPSRMGSGLGLCLVKNVIDFMGWNLFVKSSDKGSVFTLTC